MITAPITATVRWISSAASNAGLNPHTAVLTYRNVIEIRLDAGGADGTFGAVSVGAHTGRVLRGWLRTGNDGITTRYGTGRAMLAALRQLPTPRGR